MKASNHVTCYGIYCGSSTSFPGSLFQGKSENEAGSSYELDDVNKNLQVKVKEMFYFRFFCFVEPIVFSQDYLFLGLQGCEPGDMKSLCFDLFYTDNVYGGQRSRVCSAPVRRERSVNIESKGT